MLQNKKLGFVGGGQMCEAIFSGALSAGALQAANISITDISAPRLSALREKYGVQTFANNEEGAGIAALLNHCDIIVLAIKPQHAASALSSGGAFPSGTLVISIIGGLPLATLEGLLPASPLIRVMPNTPMMVGKGCAGIAAGSRATAEHLALCQALFDAVGSSFVVPENLLDPLTAISGCGPAFAYLFLEALADGGVEQGLPRAMAQQLAAQTLAGAAEMVLQSGSHPARLKDQVCSPGGGTIAGVHALEAGGLRGTVMDAVAASKARMEALGKG